MNFKEFARQLRFIGEETSSLREHFEASPAFEHSLQVDTSPGRSAVPSNEYEGENPDKKGQY